MTPYRPVSCRLFLLAVVSLCVAYALHVREQEFQQTYSFAQGTLLNLEIRTTRINREVIKRFYHPILRLDLPEGENKTVILSDGSEVKRQVSDPLVTVYYPKDSPNDAKRVEWTQTRQPIHIALGVALASFLAALHCWRSRRQLAKDNAAE